MSLNLINGYTGQFSLGHAVSWRWAPTRRPITRRPNSGRSCSAFALGRRGLFPVALLAGGLVAALAGLLVGAPSLRLKGDYLAIVTLGFGEIIRVIFQNIEAARRRARA